MTSISYEATMAEAGGVATTETQNVQFHRSNSYDRKWADIVTACLAETDPASSNLNFDMFGIDDIPAHFGAESDHHVSDRLLETAGSSLASSISDPNSAPHSFEDWSTVPNRPTNHPPVPYPGPWVSDQYFEQPASFGMPIYEGLGVQMSPTSHPVEAQKIVPCSQSFMGRPSLIDQNEVYRPGSDTTWGQHEHGLIPHEAIFGDDDYREGCDPADPCYAQLLYQCLKEAPNYTLSLRELYDWVSRHSQKAKDPKNRGWQNSVRHNLSMNAAFARVPHGTNVPGPKKGSLWRLTDEALRDGVISTTRYRKDPKRKAERRGTPALNRQTSGAKGGRATRDATRLRQQLQQQQQHHHHRITQGIPTAIPSRRLPPRSGAHYSPYLIPSAETSPQPGFLPPTPSASPYFINDPTNMTLPISGRQTPLGHHVQGAGTPPSRLQFHFDNDFKAEPQPDLSPYTSNFEFLPLDFGQGGLFADQDPELLRQQPDTPTPSLMTEASFMTDENLPLLTSTTSMPSNGIQRVDSIEFP